MKKQKKHTKQMPTQNKKHTKQMPTQNKKNTKQMPTQEIKCADCNIKLEDNISPNMKSICLDCYDNAVGMSIEEICPYCKREVIEKNYSTEYKFKMCKKCEEKMNKQMPIFEEFLEYCEEDNKKLSKDIKVWLCDFLDLPNRTSPLSKSERNFINFNLSKESQIEILGKEVLE